MINWGGGKLPGLYLPMQGGKEAELIYVLETTTESLQQDKVESFLASNPLYILRFHKVLAHIPLLLPPVLHHPSVQPLSADAS